MERAGTDMYELVERAGIEVVTWPSLEAVGVDAVVTTRHGGVSEGPYATLNLGLHVGDDADRVIENRRRAAAAVGLGLDDLVFGNQSHGPSVAVVGRAEQGRGAHRLDDAIDRTDAFVTTEPGVGLVVMVADCVPLVLVDPEARVLACVHAGWRGTVARVTEAAVHAMVAEGAAPHRLLVAIGPAISPARYQVGEEVRAAAHAGLGDAADELVPPDGEGRWRFDLWGANRRVLAEGGVPHEQVHVAAVDSGDDRFFSDRAERPCGRFAVIAALRS